MMNQQDPALAASAMQEIMNTGDNDPEAVLLRERKARQNAMRQAGMAPMQGTVNAGRAIIPNWGGMLMQGAHLYNAHKMQQGLDQSTREVMGRTNAARGAYADRLIQALRRPMPQMQQFPQRPMPGPDVGIDDYRGSGF